MTDHKFTDDEIIKALECCAKLDRSFEECDKCPYKGECGTKDGNMPADALALINRQKAMIKRLGKEKKNIKFETGDYAKIADNKSGHSFELGTIVKLEKCAEDYKAFANGDFWWVTDADLVEIDNDTLVKEMTEDQK